MSFSNSLRRLQAAADYRQPGIAHDHCIVNRSDLRELLNDWSRLDAQVRTARLAAIDGVRFVGELTPTPYKPLADVVAHNVDTSEPPSHPCKCDRNYNSKGKLELPTTLTCMWCGGRTLV